MTQIASGKTSWSLSEPLNDELAALQPLKGDAARTTASIIGWVAAVCQVPIGASNGWSARSRAVMVQGRPSRARLIASDVRVSRAAGLHADRLQRRL